jgi:hypothetical protein
MEIISGKIKSAQKVVVYGPEGIGKTSFAAQFPDPVFIDTEGSTKYIDVRRTVAPSSWTMLLSQVDEIRSSPDICKTLVIDTADWAEMLCSESVCASYQKRNIEEFGYGKGYVYLAEEFGRLLNKLNDVIDLGIHVVFVAHATMRKFEQPDEWGSYDRWELKLQRKTAPLLKEWADMLLFVNYKTIPIKDNKSQKIKAQGGKRVMYTSHHSCWDAKNRHDLDEELDFSFVKIAHCFDQAALPENQTSRASEITQQPKHSDQLTQDAEKPKTQLPTDDPDNNIPFFDSNEKNTSGTTPDTPQETPPPTSRDPDGPDHLNVFYELANFHHTPIEDVMMAVEYKGYYPRGTPIENYDPDFVTGVLIAAWPQVFDIIQELKNGKRSA